MVCMTLLYTPQADSGFTSVGLSFFSSIVMMIGELNYLDWFVQPANDSITTNLRFEKMAFFVLILFMLFMPILLMNLLVRDRYGQLSPVPQCESGHRFKAITCRSVWLWVISKVYVRTRV